jgi:hypothetical protein
MAAGKPKVQQKSNPRPPSGSPGAIFVKCNINHHVSGKRLKQRAKTIDRERLRHGENRLHVELMTRRRRAHMGNVGNQLFDADAARRQVG